MARDEEEQRIQRTPYGDTPAGGSRRIPGSQRPSPPTPSRPVLRRPKRGLLALLGRRLSQAAYFAGGAVFVGAAGGTIVASSDAGALSGIRGAFLTAIMLCLVGLLIELVAVPRSEGEGQ